MMQQHDSVILEQARHHSAELQTQLDSMKPLLRKMHLLSSNAVSTAARAGSDGNAFRVLAQSIAQLCQEINTALKDIEQVLAELKVSRQSTGLSQIIYHLADALSALPIAVKRGEHLAIYSSVEAVHVGAHVDSFESVATMLKQLIADLRQHTIEHKRVMSDLLALLG